MTLSSAFRADAWLAILSLVGDTDGAISPRWSAVTGSWTVLDRHLAAKQSGHVRPVRWTGGKLNGWTLRVSSTHGFIADEARSRPMPVLGCQATPLVLPAEWVLRASSGSSQLTLCLMEPSEGEKGHQTQDVGAFLKPEWRVAILVHQKWRDSDRGLSQGRGIAIRSVSGITSRTSSGRQQAA